MCSHNLCSMISCSVFMVWSVVYVAIEIIDLIDVNDDTCSMDLQLINSWNCTAYLSCHDRSAAGVWLTTE